MSASAEKLRPDNEHIVLSVGQDGQLFWQGRETTVNEVFPLLGEEAIVNPDRRVRVDADYRAPL